MGMFDSIKSVAKGTVGNVLDYGSKALNFASPFAGAAADFGLGIWSNHQQYKQAQGLSTHQMRLNKQYNEWQIPYQLGQEYEFASRYGKNSPSWNVKGLRKAGLNPILAVNGGFSGGNAPHASGGSVGSGGSTNANVRMDVLSAINAHKQNQLLDQQIEGQKIRNNNEKMNMGLSGRDATVARLANELGLTPDRVRSFLGFDFGTKDKSTGDGSPGDLLGLKGSDKDKVNGFFYRMQHRPMVTVGKPADRVRNHVDHRFFEPGSGSESYKQWLAHPSNSRYRGNTYNENAYLFERDVKSGFWRKKRSGKYGYK